MTLNPEEEVYFLLLLITVLTFDTNCFFISIHMVFSPSRNTRPSLRLTVKIHLQSSCQSTWCVCEPLGALESHLSPVPLTLCCCRRHLGFLLAGFELLSCLNNLTGVILTGGTVPGRMTGKHKSMDNEKKCLPKDTEIRFFVGFCTNSNV